ncbi:hypothetical protein [Nocardia sp. NPDC052566]|uniref:hypothetical protein n=1 Tax=Nocardia sp. NPDC052566 TaxID=3364330 RepID=UPI0037CC8642
MAERDYSWLFPKMPDPVETPERTRQWEAMTDSLVATLARQRAAELSGGDLGGKVHTYERMNEQSATRMLERIYARDDLDAVARTEIQSNGYVAQTPVTDARMLSAPSVPQAQLINDVVGDALPSAPMVLPQAKEIVDPQAFAPMDDFGNRPAQPSTVPNPNNSALAPRPPQSALPQNGPSTPSVPAVPAQPTPAVPARPGDNQSPGATPRDPFPMPDTTGRSEGDEWDEVIGDRTVHYRIPFGNGNQSVDQEITDANGGVTRMRVVANGRDGYQRWTLNADGSAYYESVEHPGALVYSQDFKRGSSTSGRPDLEMTRTPDRTRIITPSHDESGALVGYDIAVPNKYGMYDNYHYDNDNNLTVSAAKPDGKGGIESTFVKQVNNKGYGWEIDKGIQYDITPEGRTGFDYANKRQIVETKEGENTHEKIYDYRAGKQIADTVVGSDGSIISGWTKGANGEKSEFVQRAVLGQALAREVARLYKFNTENTPHFVKTPAFEAAFRRLEILGQLTFDQKAMVKVTADGEGNILSYSLISAGGVERVITTADDEFERGKPFEFSIHPDGRITDRDGGPVIQVGGRFLRVDSKGDVQVPPYDAARNPSIFENERDPSKPRFGAESLLEVPTAGIRTPDRAGLLHAYTEIHAPPGVNAKLYKVDSGGILFEDATGLHWATDPGEARTATELAMSYALEASLLLAPTGISWAAKGASAAARLARSLGNISTKTAAETRIALQEPWFEYQWGHLWEPEKAMTQLGEFSQVKAPNFEMITQPPRYSELSSFGELRFPNIGSLSDDFRVLPSTRLEKAEGILGGVAVRVQNLDEWVGFHAAKADFEFSEALYEIREARRLLDRYPGTEVRVALEEGAPIRPGGQGRYKEFDMALMTGDGMVVRTVEVTSLKGGMESYDNLTTGVRHGLDKVMQRDAVGAPMPRPRDVSIYGRVKTGTKSTKRGTKTRYSDGRWVQRKPGGEIVREGNLFDEALFNLNGTPNVNLLDRVTFIDADSGAVLTEMIRIGNEWSRIR